jgi:hypothetical protein
VEQMERYEVEDLIREAGGLRATHRKSGVALETLRTGRRGIREWALGTRAKLALAWGVEIGEVRWPTGGTPTDTPQVPPRRESPKVDLDDLYEDGELKAKIEALIEREVERRVAGRSAERTETTEGN